MECRVLDNFLDNCEFLNLKELLLSNTFPYFYNERKYDNSDKNLENFQFTHILYRKRAVQSEYFHNFKILLDKINPVSILDMKINLTTYIGKQYKGDLHTDVPGHALSYKKDSDIVCDTLIYYINTNNGYTVFKDGTKIDSVENRLIIFKSNLMHTAVHATDQKVRCLINMNMIGVSDV